MDRQEKERDCASCPRANVCTRSYCPYLENVNPKQEKEPEQGVKYTEIGLLLDKFFCVFQSTINKRNEGFIDISEYREERKELFIQAEAEIRRQVIDEVRDKIIKYEKEYGHNCNGIYATLKEPKELLVCPKAGTCKLECGYHRKQHERIAVCSSIRANGLDACAGMDEPCIAYQEPPKEDAEIGIDWERLIKGHCWHYETKEVNSVWVYRTSNIKTFAERIEHEIEKKHALKNREVLDKFIDGIMKILHERGHNLIYKSAEQEIRRQIVGEIHERLSAQSRGVTKENIAGVISSYGYTDIIGIKNSIEMVVWSDIEAVLSEAEMGEK